MRRKNLTNYLLLGAGVVSIPRLRAKAHSAQRPTAQKRCRGYLLLGLLGLLGLPAGAAAQAVVIPVTISTAADTTTTIPGGTGSFLTFAPVGYPPTPWISFGNVAFFGAGSAGQAGIYLLPPGPPTRIADQNTVIPGAASDTFTMFQSNPSISGNNVVFAGGDATHTGVYASIGGTLTTIADLTTTIPGGTGMFSTFQTPGVSGSGVAFIGGDGATQTGVYRCYPPSPCTPVADTHTAIPGGIGNFASFLPNPFPGVGISGGNVAFIGGDATFTQMGVYAAYPASPFFPIADQTTQAPGQPAGTLFLLFTDVSISGTAVAFRGLSSPDGGKDVFDGVYVAAPPSPISAIADTSTPVPGGAGSFSAFGVVSIDPSHVAFEGFSSGGAVKGIYTNAGGGLTKIIDTTDMLGGKQVSAVNLGPGGFSGDQVVFAVDFTDGSHAVSVATIGAGIRCPLSQGYWKNHAALWPETSLVLGNQNYSQPELLAILGASSNGDASLILAKQLIAAKLNIFNFSDPTPASAAIANADGLLSGFAGKLPYHVNTTSPTGQAMLGDATTLDHYNNALLTPGCTE